MWRKSISPLTYRIYVKEKNNVNCQEEILLNSVGSIFCSNVVHLKYFQARETFHNVAALRGYFIFATSNMIKIHEIMLISILFKNSLDFVHCTLYNGTVHCHAD